MRKLGLLVLIFQLIECRTISKNSDLNSSFSNTKSIPATEKIEKQLVDTIQVESNSQKKFFEIIANTILPISPQPLQVTEIGKGSEGMIIELARSEQRKLVKAFSGSRAKKKLTDEVKVLKYLNENAFKFVPKVGKSFIDEKLEMGAFEIEELESFDFNNDSLVWESLIALRSLHKLGVWHRDISPGNLMQRNNEPVIIDFGQTMEESAIGTIPFSPSSLEGPNRDLAALGRAIISGRYLKFIEKEINFSINNISSNLDLLKFYEGQRVSQDIQKIESGINSKNALRYYLKFKKNEERLALILNYLRSENIDSVSLLQDPEHKAHDRIESLLENDSNFKTVNEKIKLLQEKNDLNNRLDTTIFKLATLKP